MHLYRMLILVDVKSHVFQELARISKLLDGLLVYGKGTQGSTILITAT